jgi:hypothetical protein
VSITSAPNFDLYRPSCIVNLNTTAISNIHKQIYFAKDVAFTTLNGTPSMQAELASEAD